jgi:hypothetical protein
VPHARLDVRLAGERALELAGREPERLEDRRVPSPALERVGGAERVEEEGVDRPGPGRLLLRAVALSRHAGLEDGHRDAESDDEEEDGRRGRDAERVPPHELRSPVPRGRLVRLDRKALEVAPEVL